MRYDDDRLGVAVHTMTLRGPFSRLDSGFTRASPLLCPRLTESGFSSSDAEQTRGCRSVHPTKITLRRHHWPNVRARDLEHYLTHS